MARVCEVCGKGPIKARAITRKGKPKKEGGIGLHTHRAAKRRQLPNLKKIRVIVDGKPGRMTVCTRCLRSRKIVKRSVKVKSSAN